MSVSHDNYNILIEFVHRHLEFQRPELESILSLHDIQIGRDCVEISLPTPSEEGKVKNHRPFVILSFSFEYAEKKFNLDDEGEKLSSDISRYSTINKDRPTIASLLSRCTLIRSVLELWGSGTTFDSCADNVRSLSHGDSTCTAGKQTFSKCSKPSSSWKITIHTLGTKFNREEQNVMRATFAFLNFPGKVQMVEPTNEYLLIREIELDSAGTVIHKGDNSRPPIAVYYGRVLGGLRDWRGDNRLEQYSLKKRSYLGPTSMDAELSLVMTNLGLVQKGFMCFEPFVGTGSILLTCGLRGGYCIGTDIDIRVLRGRSEEENVLTNFDQYKLHRPDLVRSDNAIYHRHYRTDKPIYDAIITDPPYGIRAGARKTGSKEKNPQPIPDEHRHDHIAQTKVYAVSDVMSDLLDVSAKTLVMKARLVYIIPSMTDFDVDTDLPRHECLRLVYVCYQPLQVKLGRRVVVMEKVKEYDVSQRDRYLSNVWVNGPESAEKCANIREKLIEAARLKPGYEEKAAYRKKKRLETKEANKKAKLETKKKAISHQFA